MKKNKSRLKKFNEEVEQLREEKYKNSHTWQMYLKDINKFRQQLFNN
jgi:hypothetical protein